MAYVESQKFLLRNYFPEFMFSLFMSLFSLAKPIIQSSGYTVEFLFIITILCIVILIYKVKQKRVTGYYNILIVCTIIVFILLIIDFLGRYNENTSSYLYNYFLYGFLSFIFISYVRYYKPVLWYFSIIAIINGIMYLPDPIFNNYELSGGYMQLGFNSLMPAFSGAIILFYYFHRKWAISLIFLFLVALIIFANKSAFLSALIVLAFGHVFIKKNGKIGVVSIITLCAALVLFITLGESVILYGFKIAEFLGFPESYSLRTFDALFTGEGDLVLGARFDVWNEAIKMIDAKPVTGWGVGWFEKYSIQPYPHNIILEIMVEYGIIGLIIFLLLFLKSIYNMLSMRSYEKKIFTIIIFILWISPLSVSVTFWKLMSFWIYWFLCFSPNREHIAIK